MPLSLPRLKSLKSDALSAIFVQALKDAGFKGDTTLNYSDRLVVATDNSIYQLLPQAVVLPKDEADLVLLMELANQKDFCSLKFFPRGGGTGTNGQSLGDGVVVDVSRHMNHILEINEKEGWVKVQPGVVLDQLNSVLKPRGFFFAPTVSPSNRATLGGMVSTDASGKGSLLYGKTYNHVLALKTVLSDSSRVEFSPLTAVELEKKLKMPSREGEIYRSVFSILKRSKKAIDEKFPKLTRYMSAYNLVAVTKTPDMFDMNAILCGSEGTLLFLTELKLRITPSPKGRAVVAIAYSDFDSALRHARELLKWNPESIETLDDQVLALARNDSLWREIGQKLDAICPAGQLPKALHFVEFATASPTEALEKAKALWEFLSIKQAQHAMLGSLLAQSVADINALANLRKGCVGLLGNLQGSAKAIAFMEDTAVPPENLADHIAALRAMLERHQLKFGMFGHVDAGCIHVRPAIDMRAQGAMKLIRHLSDEAAAIAQKHGGVMWGEHGKGFRAEFSQKLLGEELYMELRHIKAVFDPEGRLNPTKIATPPNHDTILKLDAVPTRGEIDSTISPQAIHSFEPALNCNGNGACFDYASNTLMCPSYKLKRERAHSPKGRAGGIREWIRLLSEADYPIHPSPSVSFFAWPKRAFYTLIRALGWTQDFSDEVFKLLDSCLSCKACTYLCPIRVDIPAMKSKFLEHYHSRYLRPLRDFLVAYSENILALLVQLPNFLTAPSEWSWLQFLIEKSLGLSNLPKPKGASNEAILKTGAKYLKLGELPQVSAKANVIIVQDAFTSFLDSGVLLDSCRFLNHCGYQVWVSEFFSSGKPAYIKGFRQLFLKTAKKAQQHLQKLSQSGIALLALEPAVGLMFNDEYAELFNKKDAGFKIFLMQEWLEQEIDEGRCKPVPLPRPLCELPALFMGHCAERGKIAGSDKKWIALLQAFGLNVQSVNTGCCGMAGSFGYETKLVHESKGIYEADWASVLRPALAKNQVVLATGYSCRSQVKRMEGQKVLHPTEFLMKCLKAGEA